MINILEISTTQIQDYRQSAILNNLEREMTEFYHDYSSRNPSISHEDICADGNYAVLTSKMNNSWVRYGNDNNDLKEK